MDEDTLTIPSAWRRRLHPRQGGTPGPDIALDPAAGEALRAAIEARASDIDDSLGNAKSDPGLVAAARRYLSGEEDPLGASIVGEIATRRGGQRHVRVVDAWCALHGAAFAAEAVAGFCRAESTWQWIDPGRVSEAWVQRLDPEREHHGSWLLPGAAPRMRAVLAAADDAEYERAVARLGECRENFLLRLLTAYLAPTRQDWVDECLDDKAARSQQYWRAWMLWCSVRSAGQAARLGGLDGLGGYAAYLDIATTVVDGLGSAAAPALAAAYDSAHNVKARRNTADLLAVLPTDEAFQALIDRADKDRVRPALAAAMKRFPVRAARLLPEAASGKGKAAKVAADLLREHLLTHPELDGGKTAASRVPDAAPGDLPASLTTPPWKRERDVFTTVLDGLVPLDGDSVRWAHGEREEWARHHHLYVNDWAEHIAEFRAGRLNLWSTVELLVGGPEDLVRPLFAEWVSTRPGPGWGMRPLAARYELDAVPVLLPVAERSPAEHGAILLPFLTARIAELMADWALRLKSARPIAHDWFARHRVAAAVQLVPAALGPAPSGTRRRAAQAALLHIAAREGDAPVIEAARVYGDDAADAVRELLRASLLDLVPVHPPKLGDWADPALLPQVLLEGRDRALPESAARTLLDTLALPAPGGARPDLSDVRAACDADSLAEFSWAVFERWDAAGHPARDGWALTQLGLIGGDEAARRLTPLIRAWPGRSRHGNAAAGLDVLAGIGTDLALAHLHGIAQKVRFKALQKRARDKIDQVARARGLTDAELADRLVPGFGLDDRGTLVLDYGPRRFTVGFDEHLTPYVLDGAGKPRKTLPKPGASDDPDLAPAAHKRFAALRKDVRTVAAAQVHRLEDAMVLRRAWPLPDFERHLAAHPLLRHLVRRLVWATADGVTFRVAEDGTYADPGDDALTLPAGTAVRIAHPLDPPGALDAWTQVFADYEIAQPFPQLNRPVHALTDEERATGHLARFDGLKIPLGRLLSLERRGWEHDIPADAGIVTAVFRALPGGATAAIGFDGVAIGHRDPAEEVAVAASITAADTLDPITESEILTDLTTTLTP